MVRCSAGKALCSRRSKGLGWRTQPRLEWQDFDGNLNGDSTGAQPAREQVCRTYRYPLYAWLRWDGRSPEAAQDAARSFLTRLLQNHRLARAHPDRGGGSARFCWRPLNISRPTDGVAPVAAFPFLEAGVGQAQFAGDGVPDGPERIQCSTAWRVKASS